MHRILPATPLGQRLATAMVAVIVVLACAIALPGHAQAATVAWSSVDPHAGSCGKSQPVSTGHGYANVTECIKVSRSASGTDYYQGVLRVQYHRLAGWVGDVLGGKSMIACCGNPIALGVNDCRRDRWIDDQTRWCYSPTKVIAGGQKLYGKGVLIDPAGRSHPVWSRVSAGRVDYVAMGDSYASGVSLGRYGSSGHCKRSTHAYAYRLAKRFAHVHPHLVACSGDTTADVGRDQLRALSRSTDLVTISVGGDDLHFHQLIKTCIFNRDGCSAKVNQVARTASATIAGKLAALYAKIRLRVRADTKVEVIGYPRLFPMRTHEESLRCRDVILAGVQASEQDAANHLADVLNQVIGSAARKAGFGYIDSIPIFRSHDPCARHNRYLNAIIVRHPNESYHPTELGHVAWAGAIAAAVL